MGERVDGVAASFGNERGDVQAGQGCNPRQGISMWEVEGAWDMDKLILARGLCGCPVQASGTSGLVRFSGL
jgi:hypothetical protein